VLMVILSGKMFSWRLAYYDYITIIIVITNIIIARKRTIVEK